MPGMTLRQMLEDDGAITSTLKVGRGEVNLRTISPDLATGEMLDLIVELNNANPDGLSLEQAAELLTKQALLVTKLVLWWDVIDEATGQAVPLTVPEVKKLHKKFLAMVINHVITGEARKQAEAGEAQPGATTNEDSVAPSSRQAIPNSGRLATSQNGTPGSKPPNISAFRPGTSSPERNRNPRNGRAPQWSQWQQRPKDAKGQR